MSNIITERPIVVICSPFRGDLKRNTEIAKKLCKEAIEAGYAPFASHLLYPLFLDDDKADERKAGMECGLSFITPGVRIWAYIAEGVSEGMRNEIKYAEEKGATVEWLYEKV